MQGNIRLQSEVGQSRRGLASAAFLVLATALLASGGGIAILVASRALSPDSAIAPLVAAFGIVALLFTSIVPLHLVPSLALIAYVCVPPIVLPDSPVLSFILPPAVILLVWVLRKSIRVGASQIDDHRLPAGNKFLPVLMVLFVIASAMFSIDTRTSLSWSTSFIVGVLSVLLVPNLEHSDREVHSLRKTWVWVGAVVGVLASVEYVLRTDFLVGGLYDSLQHWSVYRSIGTLGHPLVLSTFLLVALILGIGSWLTGRDANGLALGCCAGFGMVATSSRGPLLAAVFTLLALTVFTFFASPARRVRSVVLGVAGLCAMVLVLLFSPLADRSESIEASRSSDARDSAYSETVQAFAERPAFGWGAGASATVMSDRGEDVAIESSALQLMVSLGFVGTALFTLIVAGAARSAFSRGYVVEGFAALGLVIAFCTFNAIDERKSMHILLGLALLLLLGGSNSALRPSTRP